MTNPRLISFIARSKRRLEILKLLKEHELSQVKLTKLTKLTKMYKGHTSRTLKELSEKKLVICTNPDDRSFRAYKITRKGTEILKQTKAIIEG